MTPKEKRALEAAIEFSDAINDLQDPPLKRVILDLVRGPSGGPPFD